MYYLTKVQRQNFRLHKQIQEFCVNVKKLSEYTKGKNFYCWHIDDLKVYDRPKELNEFRHSNCEFCKHIKNDIYLSFSRKLSHKKCERYE